MRESHAEGAIPTSVESPVYLDAQQIARGLGRHMTETFLAQDVGASGGGFDIVNVPFEPALVVAINPAGAAPALWHSAFPAGGTAHHTVTILAVAASATPPVLVKVADNDWTVEIPTAMAPDAEVVTVLIYGVREGNGSL